MARHPRRRLAPSPGRAGRAVAPRADQGSRLTRPAHRRSRRTRTRHHPCTTTPTMTSSPRSPASPHSGSSHAPPSPNSCGRSVIGIITVAIANRYLRAQARNRSRCEPRDSAATLAHACYAGVADAHTHAVIRMFAPRLGSAGGHAHRAARCPIRYSGTPPCRLWTPCCRVGQLQVRPQNIWF